MRPAGDVASRREPSLSEWETDSDPPTDAEEEEEGGNKENMGDTKKVENKVNGCMYKSILFLIKYSGFSNTA